MSDDDPFVWADGTVYDPSVPGYRQATEVEPPEPCPMGCGRTTEDPYGGPCSACWEACP